MTDQEPDFYLEEEIDQSLVYTEDDCHICNLDCGILHNCRLGNTPKTITIEDAELCIG